MSNEKFELFTDEVTVSEANSIFTMILADVPSKEIAARLNITEYDVEDVMREFIKDELLA
jgi:FixJ family two-component response regulator